jgi:hypothetical protein
MRPEGEPVKPAPKSEVSKYLPGVILIAIGIIFLVDNIFWWFSFGFIWPLGLIAVGLVLILKSASGHEEEGRADESSQS